MASKILVAALLASGALGRVLPNGRDVASVEAREPTVASNTVPALVVKRSPQGGGGASGGFDFGDYANQEEFWAEWGTEQEFFAEHAPQFESEDDFWEQLEAALPSAGGEGGAFSFADYETQEDFWAEWVTEEEFFAAHGSQFESEDDFWQQLEAALPEGGASEGAGGGAGEGGGVTFPGFPGGGFGGGGGGGGSEDGPEETPVADPIFVVGPIDD